MKPEGSLLDSSKTGSICTMYHCDTFLSTTVTVEKTTLHVCVLFSYIQILCVGQQFFHGKWMSLEK